MARYIDADALIEHLEDNLRECGNPDMDTEPITYGCSLGLKGALSYAQTLPTTDVVEVVRCKDCKRLMEYAEGKQRIEGADGDCSIRMMNTSDEQFWGVTFNDYCSYGKRKGGN